MALATMLLFAMAPAARSQAVASGQTAAQAGQGVAITQAPHYRLLYQNTDMRVLDMALPAHQSTLPVEHDYDYIFVTLTSGVVSVARPGQPPVQMELPAGAVRFERGGSSSTMTNDGGQAFLDVTIEFLNAKLTAGGCACNAGPTDALCNCPDAPALPPNWETRIGRVSLAAVTLRPGATYSITSQKTTRLLVAVTSLHMIDGSIHEPKDLNVRLPAGRFHWLSPGPHKIQNVTSQPLRFLSVEFWGTPENPTKDKDKD